MIRLLCLVLVSGALVSGNALAAQHKKTAPPIAPVSTSANNAPAAAVSSVNAPANDAKNAYLLDFDTGRVLYDKHADDRMPTSSMSKMLTIYLVFEQLKQGHLALDSKLPVSEKAWRTGLSGSDMFLNLNDNVKIEDLIRGVIIQSGNDATVVLAEGIAGSEDAFAERMNLKAHELGMTESHFVNASGMPNPEHYSSCRDLAILAKHLIVDFPEYYHFFSEKEFTWNNIKQGNRNPLLYRNIGVDGLKTGHADQAGYGLTASGVENNHRLILVMNGMPSMQARADEPATLLEWGWHEYRLFNLFKTGQVVDDVPVWLGEAKTVSIALDHDVKVTMTNEERHNLKATIVYDGSVAAPIKAGQKIAIMRVTMPNVEPQEFSLVASVDVARLGVFPRMFAALHTLVSGHP